MHEIKGRVAHFRQKLPEFAGGRPQMAAVNCNYARSNINKRNRQLATSGGHLRG
jgi:hypothetical protein